MAGCWLVGAQGCKGGFIQPKKKKKNFEGGLLQWLWGYRSSGEFLEEGDKGADVWGDMWIAVPREKAAQGHRWLAVGVPLGRAGLL